MENIEQMKNKIKGEEDEEDFEEDNESSENTVQKFSLIKADVENSSLEKPKTKRDQIREALLAGESSKSLISRGYNRNSVRTIASEMKKEFGREFGTSKEVTNTPLQVFAKGSPPEALINSVAIPNGIDGLKEFELGMKFGLSTLVMGVRMAQELSSIGIAQAQPLIKMAAEMRAGEIQAAEHAAGEAANLAAGSLMEGLMPFLQERSSGSSEGKSSIDPMMRSMMMRVIEPLMKSLTNRLMPGYSEMAGDQIPTGWTRTRR